jgi:hypothetical protein
MRHAWTKKNKFLIEKFLRSVNALIICSLKAAAASTSKNDDQNGPHFMNAADQQFENFYDQAVTQVTIFCQTGRTGIIRRAILFHQLQLYTKVQLYMNNNIYKHYIQFFHKQDRP